MTFQPELGQYAFSNTPWQTMEMQPEVEAALARIGEQIGDRELLGDPGQNPMANSGARYENEVFKARAYCWCDGAAEGHEEGCPPNFEWRDFRACWYKWVGRGNSQNRALSTAEIREMEDECLASLPPGYPGGYKRRRRDLLRGDHRCVCGHPRWMHPEGGCDGARWEVADADLDSPLIVLPRETADTCACAGFKRMTKRNEPADGSAA